MPEFRNTNIADSFKRGAFFDDPDVKPMKSEGRGQRAAQTGYRERQEDRRPDIFDRVSERFE